MTNFADMNKAALRAACKEAGIKYGNLDNAGMRAALEALEAAKAPAVEATPATKGTGLKIEKDRAMQNGVTRPSVGGKCHDIWSAMDKFVEDNGRTPALKEARAIGTERGWNKHTTSIQFYQWKAFTGR